ncbi:MAG: MMPL family transporter [Deltaproteobacteria bacterium]|nr:MMPL family transporter [Deltaproteobacteria bacterium]
MYLKLARPAVRLFHRHPLIVLTVIFLAFAAAIPSTIRLFGTIQTDLSALLPESYHSVQLIRKARDKMEGLGSLIIVLEGDKREGIIQFASDLSKKLSGDSLIKEVVSTKPGYQFFSDHKLLYVDLEDLEEIRDRIDRRIQREKLGGLLINLEEGRSGDRLDFKDIEEEYRKKYSEGKRSPYYESDDGRVFLIHVYPTGTSSDFGFAKKVTRYVSGVVEDFDIASYDPSLKVYYAGTFQTRINEYNALIQDLALAGLIAVVGITLLLLLRFRNPVVLLLLLAPMGIGLVWTFGLTRLFIGNLNVVTSFLFSILSGLGIEFGIHLFSRYLEAKESGKEPLAAIEEMITSVGRSSLTSSATAGVPFLLLGFNDFKGFSEFGLITGSGIFITLLAYLLTLPPLIVILERFHLLRVRAIHKGLFLHNRGTRFHYARPLFWGALILSMICLAFIPRLRFEYDFNKLKPKLPFHEEIRKKVHKVVPPVNSPAMVIVERDEEAALIKEALLTRKKLTSSSLIQGVKIATDLVPKDQEAKEKILSDIQKMIEEPLIQKGIKKGGRKKALDEFVRSLDVPPVTLDDVPDEAKRIFYGRKEVPGQVIFIFADPDVELSDGRIAMRFQSEVAEIPTAVKTYHATSDAIVFADVLKVMLRDSKKAIALAVFGVLFFVILDFRKPIRVALVMLPIVGGIFWMCGLMGMIDFRFSFYNMVVIPSVVGTAIDNGVHMYHRYMEERFSAVGKVVRTAGQAAFLSSLTNIIGFLGLVFAEHNGLASIGKAAMIGMVACMVCSLTLFPAALQLLEDWRKKGTL